MLGTTYLRQEHMLEKDGIKNRMGGETQTAERCSLAIFVTRVAIVLHDVFRQCLKLEEIAAYIMDYRDCGCFCGADLHVLDFDLNFFRDRYRI